MTPLRASAPGAVHAGSAHPVTTAVLLPHAPILVPPVGGARGQRARATVHAMRAAARHVVAAQPDAVVLVSPHMPRRRDAFALLPGDRVAGDLSAFNTPEAGIDLPAAPTLRHAIADEGTRNRLAFWYPNDRPLDHGTVVPLWFLAEAGWNGPTVVIGLGYGAEDAPLEALGESIARAALNLDLRIALVASGDMSHRLTPDAPCGHHPRATESDAEFIRLLREGRYRDIACIDPRLLDLAAEDATESTRIAVAATGGDTTHHSVLSYEGPFGVGYGVAILNSRLPAPGPAGECASIGPTLLDIARRSIEAAVRGSPEHPPEPACGPLRERRAVFVTLHLPSGHLRGCIGTLRPRFDSVAEETWRMAREAALSDNRFDPVGESELDDLVIEVSVLSPPEPIESPADLDPARYGVIVRATDGRCGTLLPDIPSIRTPEEQVSIARRKAGIRPDEPITLERYTVEKYSESPGRHP